MKCPYCHKPLGPSDVICPSCGHALPEHIESDAPQSFWDRRLVRAILFVLGAAIAIFVIGFAIYKLTFWMEDYQIERLYARGERTPVVSEITLDDGRMAHAINFFAEDGDRSSSPNCSAPPRWPATSPAWRWPTATGSPAGSDAGGKRRSEPFAGADRRKRRAHAVAHHRPDHRPAAIAGGSAQPRAGQSDRVHLRISAGGAGGSGRTVLVNGEDVTDVVDRSGLLSANVNVYPIGDNIISILVRTPNHLETRRDVTIYRAQLEIEVELDTSVRNETDSRQMLISGSCEPGAYIEVDTPYVEESLYINMETGDFEFLTDLEYIGENTVRFRATMDGARRRRNTLRRQLHADAGHYSAAAWPLKENYDQLVRLYAQWQDRVFLCVGKIVDIIEEDTLR